MKGYLYIHNLISLHIKQYWLSLYYFQCATNLKYSVIYCQKTVTPYSNNVFTKKSDLTNFIFHKTIYTASNSSES